MIYSKPQCRCCLTIASFIARHLDPDGLLQRSDDAANVLAQLNETFRPSGGCGVSLDQLQAFLDMLPAAKPKE